MVVSRCARAAPALLALLALLVQADVTPCGEDTKGSTDGVRRLLKPQLMESGVCENYVHVKDEDCKWNETPVGLRVSACDDDSTPIVKVSYDHVNAVVKRTGDCKGWGSIRTTVYCHEYDSVGSHDHESLGSHGF